MRPTSFVKYGLKRTLKRFFRIALTFGLVLGIIYLGKYLVSHNKLKIQNVKYSGVVKYVNPSDFENVAKSYSIDQNFLTFKTTALEETLKKTFQGIKYIKVIKTFPNTINIQIQERVPAAVVKDIESSQFLIDDEGYVLGSVDNSYFDLPTVNYDGKIYVGQFIDKNLVPLTMEILNSAKVENVQISSLSFKPQYSIFYAQNEIQVLLDNAKDIKNSLKVISRLIAQSLLENRKLAKIDLRYDKVIVLYK